MGDRLAHIVDGESCDGDCSERLHFHSCTRDGRDGRVNANRRRILQYYCGLIPISEYSTFGQGVIFTSTTSKSVSAFVIGILWQSGMREDVAFAAEIDAILQLSIDLRFISSGEDIGCW